MANRYRYLEKRRKFLVRNWRPFVVVGVLAVAGLGLFVHYSRQSLLPAAVANQVSFVVYYPSSAWSVPTARLSYTKQTGVLTLSAVQSGTTLAITEQAAPSQFSDIPQYYPALINKLGEYQNFGTVNGTVYLTRPKELAGGTEAVLNNDGTLVFVHPSRNLSTDSWRTFFNSARTVK